MLLLAPVTTTSTNYFPVGIDPQKNGLPGSEKPGILDAAGHIRDLSGIVKDIDGKFLSEGGIERVANIDLTTLPVVADDYRYGP